MIIPITPVSPWCDLLDAITSEDLEAVVLPQPPQGAKQLSLDLNHRPDIQRLVVLVGKLKQQLAHLETFPAHDRAEASRITFQFEVMNNLLTSILIVSIEPPKGRVVIASDWRIYALPIRDTYGSCTGDGDVPIEEFKRTLRAIGPSFTAAMVAAFALQPIAQPPPKLVPASADTPPNGPW